MQAAPAGTEGGVARDELVALREAILALARYGASHPTDEWVRTVEPALESFLEEAEARAVRSPRTAPGPRAAKLDLAAAFLRVIEAQERARTSR